MIKQLKSRLLIKLNSLDILGSNSYFIQIYDNYLSKAKLVNCVRHCGCSGMPRLTQSQSLWAVERGYVPCPLPNSRRIKGQNLILCRAQQYGISGGSVNSYS